MNTRPLGEVADINPRFTATLREDDEIPFLPMAAVSEEGFIIAPEIKKGCNVNQGYSYFAQGDVIVAKITPCFENGKAAYVESLPGPFGFGSTEFHVIRPQTTVLDAKYLLHFIQTRWFLIMGAKRMTGSAGQRRVPTDFLRTVPIPLPKMQEQRRIAEILDVAKRLHVQRRNSIQLADELLRSIFLDMFGDPITNPKGWERKPLGTLGVLARGKSKHRPRNDPALLGGPHPLIQTGDVANADNFIRGYLQTYSDLGLKQSKLWPKGTLCITIAANIADTAVLDFDACFPDSVVGFTPGKEATTEYIHFWLRSYQRILQERAPESAQKNINLEILNGLKVGIPPIEEQLKFVHSFNHVESLKGNLRAGVSETSALFLSLQQKAFHGEL